MSCKDCIFWKKSEDSNLYKDWGLCSKLSAEEGEEYPDHDKTGLDATPLSIHDGSARTFETKSWFSCCHYKSKKFFQSESLIVVPVNY